MRYLALIPFFAVLPHWAGAAVSGFYDSGAQIQAILSSAELGDAVRQAPIHSLEQVKPLEQGARWLVRTQDCVLWVDVRSTPPAGVGRTQWQVAALGACQ